MSTPRVGSSSRTTVGETSSHLARTTFCWLPPDSSRHVGRGSGGPDAEAADLPAGDASAVRRVSHGLARPHRSHRHLDDVGGDAAVEHQSLRTAVGRHEAHPPACRRRRTAWQRAAVGIAHRPRRCASPFAEQRAEQQLDARAGDPRQTDDLAGPGFEADVDEPAADGQVLDDQRRDRRRLGAPPRSGNSSSCFVPTIASTTSGIVNCRVSPG